MNWKYQIHKNGYLRTIDESGTKRKPKAPQTEPKEKIDMCLNCTKKKCNGNCIDIRRKEMKNKVEIIRIIELDNDIVILVGKKIKQEVKHCKDCPHFKYFGDLSIHYCDKHKGVVDATDICIEVGM